MCGGRHVVLRNSVDFCLSTLVLDLPQVARYVYTSRGTIKVALEKRRVSETGERTTCVTCKVLNLITAVAIEVFLECCINSFANMNQFI